MTNDDSRNWMWSEALQMLARAERLHREVFTPAQGSQRGISWEPPTDVLETADAVLIFVALPGVDAEKVDSRHPRRRSDDLRRTHPAG